MKLEKQVCSLELAKRLKELKIKQESLFQWCDISGKAWLYYGKIINSPEMRCSAFTVAELGELLPDFIKTREENYFITMDCDKHICYENMEKTSEIHFMDNFDKFTEADARAKMLIYLIENKYVES